MADPFSLSLMAAATVATVGAGIYSAVAADTEAKYDASVQQGNADRAENNAAQLTAENARRAVEFRENFFDYSKEQAVRRRKSGVEAESGSALLTALEAGREADEELERRRYNAAQGRRDIEDRAAGFRADAINIRMGGRAKRTAGYIQAGTSLLQGAERISRYA